MRESFGTPNTWFSEIDTFGARAHQLCCAVLRHNDESHKPRKYGRRVEDKIRNAFCSYYLNRWCLHTNERIKANGKTVPWTNEHGQKYTNSVAIVSQMGIKWKKNVRAIKHSPQSTIYIFPVQIMMHRKLIVVFVKVTQHQCSTRSNKNFISFNRKRH